MGVSAVLPSNAAPSYSRTLEGIRNARVGARVGRNQRGRKYSSTFRGRGGLPAKSGNCFVFARTRKKFSASTRTAGRRAPSVRRSSLARPTEPLPRSRSTSRWRVARAREESLQLGAVPCVSAAQAHLTARRPHRACMRAFYYNMRRAAALYHIARGIILYRSRQHIYRSIASCDALRAPAVRSSRPRRRLKTFFALRKSETVSGFGSRLLSIDPATWCARGSVYLPFALATPKKSKSLSPSKTPARRRGHPHPANRHLTPGAYQGRCYG